MVGRGRIELPTRRFSALLAIVRQCLLSSKLKAFGLLDCHPSAYRPPMFSAVAVNLAVRLQSARLRLFRPCTFPLPMPVETRNHQARGPLKFEDALDGMAPAGGESLNSLE